MTESTFEKKTIGFLRARGWYACHISRLGEGGFPDVLAIHGDAYRLIECKVWKGEKNVRDIFQSTQPAFYSVHGNTIDNIFCAIMEVKSVWCLSMDRNLARDMVDMTVNQFLTRSNAYLLSHESAIDWIIR